MCQECLDALSNRGTAPRMSASYDPETNEMILRIPPRAYYIIDQLLIAGCGVFGDSEATDFYNKEYVAECWRAMQAIPDNMVVSATESGYLAHVKAIAAELGMEVYSVSNRDD